VRLRDAQRQVFAKGLAARPEAVALLRSMLVGDLQQLAHA
jgi:hypothetical protein